MSPMTVMKYVCEKLSFNMRVNVDVYIHDGLWQLTVHEDVMSGDAGTNERAATVVGAMALALLMRGEIP